MSENKVLACNIKIGDSACVSGALAYVYFTNPGNASERMQVYVRSRGSRWILKHVALHNLCNFRFKTMPSENPRSGDPIVAQCVVVGNHLYNAYPDGDMAKGYNERVKKNVF